jgi:hypothetical protein
MKRILGYNVTDGAFDAGGGAENVEAVNSLVNVYADKSAAADNIIDEPVYAHDVVEVVREAYSAGVPQVSAIIFAGTVAANTAYKIVLKYRGLNDSFGMKTYAVIPAQQTIAALRDAFVSAIENDTSSLLTAVAVGGDELSLTQQDVDDMEGFEILDASALGDSDPSATATAEAVYSKPFGLGADLTESKAYPSVAFVAGNQYSAFDIIYRKYVGQAFNGGAKYEEGVYRIFANEGGANFATFSAAVLDMTNAI